jgi:predicted acyltransferase
MAIGLPGREILTKSAPAPTKPARLVSLDAYRGAIMILLASSGLGLHKVAEQPGFKDDPRWKAVAFQTDHVAWQGGTLLDLVRDTPESKARNAVGDWFGGGMWDLIQPSFMFMVGVAMPFSLASRQSRGDPRWYIGLHVLWRAFALIALGIFLRSRGSPMTNFTFEDVLTQIGLGYVFVFLLLGRGLIIQFVVLVAILAGYWALFAYYGLPAPDFNYGTVRNPDDLQPYLSGYFQHWEKNVNIGQDFDLLFLNQFPRPKPWEFNGGGYLTLNFVPSMATMLLGVMAGELLRGTRSAGFKFIALVLAGVVCLAAGIAADQTVCPIIKRIWTPSWAVYSSGWAFLILAIFFGIFDGFDLRWLAWLFGWRWLAWPFGWRWLAWPLVVVGMNSIAMYFMESTIRGWIGDMLQINLNQPVKGIRWLLGNLPEGSKGPKVLQWTSFAGEYAPIYQSAAVLLVLWLICLWMYRRKIFIRL